MFALIARMCFFRVELYFATAKHIIVKVVVKRSMKRKYIEVNEKFFPKFEKIKQNLQIQREKNEPWNTKKIYDSDVLSYLLTKIMVI